MGNSANNEELMFALSRTGVFNDKLDILESYDLYETFSVCFRLDDVLCIQNRDDKSNFRLKIGRAHV